MPEAPLSQPTPLETIEAHSRTVACDGGGALGHPRVFLFIEDQSVMCPYCSRLFVLSPGAGDDDAH